MEFVSLALIAVVLLLQVIALMQIATMRKTISEIKEIKPAPVLSNNRNERFERKGGDFRRHEKRPYQDQRPRPQQQNQTPPTPIAPAAAPAPAVDPVETSLRDINLRLKNAERDQEFARKKIQENLGDRDQQHRGHDRGERDRGERGYRDGGDRSRGGRDGNRDGNRDRNRSPRRENWQDRTRPSQQSVAPEAAQNTVDEQPTFERKEFAAPQVAATAASPVERTMPPISAAPQSAFSPASAPQAVVQQPVDFSGNDESLEHGRKVMVKRRPLKDEDGEGSDSLTTAKEETSADSTAGTEEIQFGRRKGL